MDSKARIMHGQLDCLVALAFIGLSGLCFSVVVVFIAMSTSLHSRTSGNCLDVLDSSDTVGTAWLLLHRPDASLSI